MRSGVAMTTDRRFSRFSKSPATAAFSITEIPEDGVCLSAFLIVTEAHDARKVLMGHMNPKARWDHIGALDPSRVEGTNVVPPGLWIDRKSTRLNSSH